MQNGWCNPCTMKEKNWLNGQPLGRRTVTWGERLHLLLKRVMIYDHANAKVSAQHCLLVGREFSRVPYTTVFYNTTKCARPSGAGRGKGSSSSTHGLRGTGRMGSSGTLRNSRREGTLTPTPLKKVSFTCDWELMPKELTPARPFFTKCLILRNSLSVEWTSVRRH